MYALHFCIIPYVLSFWLLAGQGSEGAPAATQWVDRSDPDPCSRGLACVPFTRCKWMCDAARDGLLTTNKTEVVQERTCGFNFEDHSSVCLVNVCCEDDSVSESKYCDMDEPSKQVKSECGMEGGQLSFFDERVVGGDDTVPGKYPWTVLLRDDGEHYLCGGAIISRKHIVTAAHCAKSEITNAVIGETNRKTEYDCLYPGDPCSGDEECFKSMNCAPKAIFREIKERIIHPEYNPSLATSEFDIAVIIIDPIKYDQWAKPVCLPDIVNYNPVQTLKEQLIMAGWGNKQDSQKSRQQESATILQSLALQDLGADACQKALNYNITANQLCGGVPGGKSVGACQGDSGSPLIRKTKTNQFELIGLVSFGLDHGCGNPEVVYTRVTADLVKWINMAAFS
ncbi:transmembrane protease serine 9 isoform X2 [Eurytemora carolleeae]|uniref:transmembrane protease serine 9 isoform X2 n=1 Tax=Eurytemora carolleeae TaxID=1294199 RepID=UPI000C78B604|nr:transmembrane protease serine 9 isoform X2 [Eurytemora carolleeae]|eukprot:XP_023324472.1 transmembrane protease serine 9-like isoform X2 [Eurytemora affinis]